jgi:phage major head subunit gpT-like protein
MVFTPQVLADLNQQFRADFDKAYTNAAINTFYASKAEVINAPGVETNVYGWLGEMPQFKKWVGQRQAKRLAARSYTLKNDDYEFSYKMHKNDIKYDRIGVYSNHAARAGRAARMIWDQLLTATQLAGITTKCYDGQNFYDTAHPTNLDDSSAATFANKYTATPLTVDNFMAVYGVMANLKDANGDPFGAVPTILEAGPTMRKKVMDVLAADLILALAKNGGTPVGGAGVSNVLKGLVEPVINDRLPDGVWFLHATGLLNPFVVQIETAPSGLMSRIDPTDPQVWNTNEFEFGALATGATGYTLPQFSAYVAET